MIERKFTNRAPRGDHHSTPNTIVQDKQPRTIPALDGLRGLAATGVLTYHVYLLTGFQPALAGLSLAFAFFYLQTGVHLFFILSGFLLFLPYAKALLDGQPLPSTWRFYRRRALRIMPVYLVCLAVLIIPRWHDYTSVYGLGNVLMHVLFLHDDVFGYNRAIDGPMWTLAVEAQFYLVLPLLAWGISRFVKPGSALKGVILGVLGVIALALGLRALDALAQLSLPHLHGALAGVVGFLQLMTGGTQGKFLGVFGLGMLCSTLYVANQREVLPLRRLRIWGRFLLICAACLALTLATIEYQHEIAVPLVYKVANPLTVSFILGPFAVGAGYGALLLGVLWSGWGIRTLCESKPLFFLGLVSYSLYLWHLPIFNILLPQIMTVPSIQRFWVALVVLLLCALPAAALSYYLIERPFLRHRAGQSGRQSSALPTRQAW